MNRRIRDSFNEVNYLCRNKPVFFNWEFPVPSSRNHIPFPGTWSTKVLSRQTSKFTINDCLGWPSSRLPRLDKSVNHRVPTEYPDKLLWQTVHTQSPVRAILGKTAQPRSQGFFLEGRRGQEPPSREKPWERGCKTNARGKNSGNCDYQLCLHIFLRSSNIWYHIYLLVN